MQNTINNIKELIINNKSITYLNLDNVSERDVISFYKYINLDEVYNDYKNMRDM